MTALFECLRCAKRIGVPYVYVYPLCRPLCCGQRAADVAGDDTFDPDALYNPFNFLECQSWFRDSTKT